MLYLQSCMFFRMVPNEKQGLLHILRHVIIWKAEKCDEAVEITKDL